MEYLIVDGYNIINAWRDVFNVQKEPLEDCRDRLLTILSNYQGYRKANVIAVFDAHLVKGSQEKQEEYDGILVVYTKENETADNYIEKFVHRLGGECLIRVATSDYLEQTMVLSNGGVRMTARELREEIEAAGRSMKERFKPQARNTNSIMSHLGPQLVERLEKFRRGGG